MTVVVRRQRPPITSHAQAVEMANLCESQIMLLLSELPDEASRVRVRKILKRRLMHPEGSTIDTHTNVHPPSGGATAASQGGPLCVCGRTRRQHDIDGQRNDCDGFVEEKW